MIVHSQKIGAKAEQDALDYLVQRGLFLIDNNVHSRRGEIDLIMRENDTLVFVEVRYRRSARFGSALESVTQKKQSRIIYTAQQYLQKHSSSYSHYRFDVIAIEPQQQSDNITWIKDAFQLS